MDQCNVLALCSGGGGLELGLDLALGCTRTVCQVEREAFAVEHLAAQMEQGILAPAPVWTDLRTFDGKPWRGVVDCVTAGYPCQPFSYRGDRRGESDPRHLWPDVKRVISEVGPSLVFCENVTGHVNLGAEAVFRDLQDLGFRIAAGLFTAAEVGAPHKRERLYILADATSNRPQRTKELQLVASASGTKTKGGHGLRNAAGNRGQEVFPPRPDAWKETPAYLAPAFEPGVCELADGLAADRVERLKLLGNGVCPLAAANAFVTLFASLHCGQVELRRRDVDSADDNLKLAV